MVAPSSSWRRTIITSTLLQALKPYCRQTSLHRGKNCHTAGKGSHGTPNITWCDCSSALNVLRNDTCWSRHVHSSIYNNNTDNGLPLLLGSNCASFHWGNVWNNFHQAQLLWSLPWEPLSNILIDQCCSSGHSLPPQYYFVVVQTWKMSELMVHVLTSCWLNGCLCLWLPREN